MTAHETALVVVSVAGAIVFLLALLLAVGEWRLRRDRRDRRGGLLELDTRDAREALGRKL